MGVNGGREALAAGLAVVLTFGSAVATTEAGAESPALSHAIEFRRDLGLSTETAEVAEIVESSADGVPLTAEERRELDRRDEAIQAAVGFAELIAARPDVFAGFELDQRSGGVVRVFVTDTQSDLVQSLLSVAPAGLDLAIQEVEKSQNDLVALTRSVLNDAESLRSVGSDLQAVGVDASVNSIHVALHPVTAAAVAFLQDRYGEAVGVSDEQFTSSGCVSIPTARLGVAASISKGRGLRPARVASW